MDEQELELDRPEWSIPGLEQARVETLAGTVLFLLFISLP